NIRVARVGWRRPAWSARPPFEYRLKLVVEVSGVDQVRQVVVKLPKVGLAFFPAAPLQPGARQWRRGGARLALARAAGLDGNAGFSFVEIGEEPHRENHIGVELILRHRGAQSASCGCFLGASGSPRSGETRYAWRRVWRCRHVAFSVAP